MHRSQLLTPLAVGHRRGVGPHHPNLRCSCPASGSSSQSSQGKPDALSPQHRRLCEPGRSAGSSRPGPAKPPSPSSGATTGPASTEATPRLTSLSPAGSRCPASRRAPGPPRPATRSPRTAGSTSRRSTLADTPLGSLYIEAVVSTSRAWHNSTGFHSTARADVADIVFDSILAPPKHLRLPLPGKSITVPGVASISLGVGTETSNARGASAEMDALKVRVIPTGTTVYLGHSAASIRPGAPTGVLPRLAFGLKADIAEGIVTSDRTPNKLDSLPRERRQDSVPQRRRSDTFGPAFAPPSCKRPPGPERMLGAATSSPTPRRSPVSRWATD